MAMFQALLARLARALDGARIPYMIVGGQAVLLYGEPRLTRDIDIILGVDKSMLELLLEIAALIRLVPSVSDVQLFVQRTNVLPLLDDATDIRVDFIFSNTVYEGEAIRRAKLINIEETVVKFASAEDLIIHKLITGRSRDLEDVRGIVARHNHLDEEYLRQWLPEFRDVTGRDLLLDYESLKKEL